MKNEFFKNYFLPDGVSPYAPRQPFIHFSDEALSSALEFIAAYPESRGTLTHAVWTLEGKSRNALKQPTITMEAHVDATTLPGNIVNELVSLGFQPDTFVQFNPMHFSDHLTLKFKADASPCNSARLHILRDTINKRAAQAYTLLNEDVDVKEAYVELEVYPGANKLSWNGDLQPEWRDAFPLPENCMLVADVPVTRDDANRSGIDLGARKHSDIHIKIAHNNNAENRKDLIKKLLAAGFYHVFTASGNDVCTAQFANAKDAKKIFENLCDYFPQYGGCSEMTWEVVTEMWRTARDGRLAAVPPLVMSLALETTDIASSDVRRQQNVA